MSERDPRIESDDAAELLGRLGTPMSNDELRTQRGFPGGILYCSFCGKSEKEVLALIAGPTVFICDQCVDLCALIVAERKAEVAAITIEQKPD